jgi:UDP-glucose 4-epimerase
VDRPIKALVTGGAGFIGSHLTERLAIEGVEVAILDDFSNSPAPGAGGPPCFTGDLREAGLVESAVSGRDWVFHLAAMNSIPRSIAEPLRSHEVNVDGTLILLEAARRAGVRRVVFASSSSVYGDIATVVKREEMPLNPLAPYPLQKLAGERYARLFTQLYGLETSSVRLFNVFGPRQRADSPYAAVIPKFCAAMLKGERPRVFGDGTQQRDFTYVADVAEAFLQVARAPAEKVSGRVFNAGAGQAVSLLELVNELNLVLGTNLPPEHGESRAGEVYRTQADISALRSLGWKPRTTLREGLRKVVAAMASANQR